MNHFFARSRAVAALALLGLGATTLLTGCFDHDKEGRDGCHHPKNSVCNTAVTVVDKSATTGCGLMLQLADGTLVVPTGRAWEAFHATAGQKLTVGYSIKKDDGDADDRNNCPAGPLAAVGCVTLNANPLNK